jgi:hypothetical protein
MKSTPENNPANEPENNHFINSVRNFRITVTFLSLIVWTGLTAQPGLRVYTDAGKNIASGGFFIKSAARQITGSGRTGSKQVFR